MKGRIKDRAAAMITSVRIAAVRRSSDCSLTVKKKTDECVPLPWFDRSKQGGSVVPAYTWGGLLLGNVGGLMTSQQRCTLALLHSHYREIKSFIHRK